MKLKKLEILGFKSFRDRTVLDFSSGISAVVGPNGCGKSNIVDAIRWVMGEQSARLLRGKKMEDVIFNGSDEAPPVNMAEVSIVLADDGRGFPGDYSECTEVMITRRVFREGESEYFINKVPCRLLDVREFFMDTGVGARTYSLVEQNSISDLVEARPEDRRLFIEEAAGIRKYRSRKEAATRKMEATRENLNRLTDIIREVKSQLNAVSRQAKRAERYKALKQEIKEADLTLSLHHRSVLTEKIEEISKTVETLNAQEVAIKTKLRQIEASTESLRADLAVSEKTLQELQKKTYVTKNSIGYKEQNLEFLRVKLGDLEKRKAKDLADTESLKERLNKFEREASSLESQLVELTEKAEEVRTAIFDKQRETAAMRKADRALQEEIEGKKNAHVEILTENARLKNMVASYAKGVEDLKRRAEREEKDIEENLRRLGDIESSLSELRTKVKEKEAYSEGLKDKQEALVSTLNEQRNALRESEENIVYLKEEKGKKAARLASLKEFHEGYLWCSEATRSIMKDKDQILAFGAVHGLVADHVEVPREYEVAVEAVLGEKLQYVVVRSQEDGIQAIDYLKAHSTGRGSFIPLEVRGHEATETPGYLAGAVKLIDRVKVKEDFQKIADYLLGDVLLIPNLETGLSLWRRNGFSGTFVTPEGDIITPHGVLTGGNGVGTESSLLRDKREISELEQEVERFEVLLKEENVRRDGLKEGIRQGEEELEGIKSEQRSLELSLHNSLKDIEGLEKEAGWVEKRLNVLRFNRENLVAEGAQAAEKISSLEIKVAANEEKCREADEAITALKERGEQSRKALENLERELTERMVLLKSLEEKEESCRSNLDRLHMEADGLEDEIAAKAADIEDCDREFLETTRKVDEEREALKSLYEAGRKMEQELAEQTASHRAKEDALRVGEAENKETRRELEKVVAQAGELQMELQGLRFQAEALKKNALEKYSVDLDGMAAGFQRPDDEQIAELTEKIAANTKAIEEFGEVNLLALSEHNVLKERYDFLTAQVADLNRSLESLQQTISRINRVSRQRFSETFEAVNARFKEVFPKLFPGGRGELRLTDESDMLETGVDIDIRTPGKKTQNVMLLSGGEKSLAAVALIFGIILYRPTPFLILDEVDAALDDSNVSLFNRLLSEIAGDSQIIIITHNKKTMEVANSLYGVTMEKSGISTLVSVNMN